MIEEQKYPRFLQNNPCGEDKFEGQSQRRLTEAIVSHIRSTDSNPSNSLPRIIGLEGAWGSGKSNVIQQIKAELKDKYYLFEYDAWGHQEDLQRRSFLERLTFELIEKKILKGETNMTIKGGGKEKTSWKEKLKYLLARKKETISEKYPRLSNSMMASILVVVFTPLFIFFASRFEKLVVSVIISLLPALIALVVWLIACIKNTKYRNLSYLLAVFNDKIESDICYETISEDEPTATEFRSWMQDISDYLEDKNHKLIIIFDNMDRLPKEKVKELWSSIHTFFSERGFENIWTIIPFDEEHMSYAFGKSDEEAGLAKHFINKTFPVVYRVTPPVITDFKKLFSDLYKEAFAETEDRDKEEINHIFRLENPMSTVRDIITFINQLVMHKTIWKNEVDIFSMAVFILKRTTLLKDPVNEILSEKYLGDNIKNITLDREFFQKNISALVYGILPDDAEQIPISKYIESCLKQEEGYDINKYINNKHFLSLLSDKIRNTDVAPDTLINVLSKITHEFEKQNKAIFSDFWDTIADKKLQISLTKQTFDETFKILLLHTNNETQREIIANVCR